jgi:nucleoside-diphosphate-sugar epimerase
MLPLPLGNDMGASLPLKSTDPLRRILVTGGCGFLGWTVTKHLAEWAESCKNNNNNNSRAANAHVQIIVVDLSPPHPSRCVSGVEYVTADLARDNLTGIMETVDAVIHTAGLVDLTADTARTYNAHIVATARLIAAARISKRCRFLVGTSSVGAITSPHIADRSQLNLPADFIPPKWREGANLWRIHFFALTRPRNFFRSG